ncbi:MAG: M50 family metallopeptidase [Candidatus Micrarchaeota archaeon]
MDILIEKDEAGQIAVSVLAISLAMGIFFAGVSGIFAYPKEFLLFLAPLFVTVGSGFILHEMAHKLAAIYYGVGARFRMWTTGLVAMLVTSLFGFLLAAPGAVVIYGRVDNRENGHIAVAGSLLNISLALFFLGLDHVAPVRMFFSFLAGFPAGTGFGIASGILQVWRFGAAMNILLALFNMIPAFPLDGSKVFRWSLPAWLIVVAALLAMGSVLISPVIVFTWVMALVFFTFLSRMIFR